MQGFINVFKPSNMSSAKVVSKIKHQFNIEKIGHMGTLDPLACGILPIAIGKATKMFDYFLNKNKEYETIIKFGESTDSYDLDGKLIETSSTIPTKDEILAVLPAFFGEQEQLPPLFSAKKVHGRKAYQLARKGESVELKPKKVNIFNIELMQQIDFCSFKFKIKCSSGTYIRCIARDLGKKLNSCAMLTYLERTNSDVFSKDNSIMLDKLLESNLNDVIIPIENVFSNIKIVNVSKEDFFKLKNGLSITHNTDLNLFFVKCDNLLLGLGEKLGNLIKIKTYLLDDAI